MSTKNADLPAMPTFVAPRMDGGIDVGFYGLTKREAFIKAAMQGLLANPGGPVQANSMRGFDYCNCGPEQIAQMSADIADAHLALLE